VLPPHRRLRGLRWQEWVSLSVKSQLEGVGKSIIGEKVAVGAVIGDEYYVEVSDDAAVCAVDLRG
jgi:hypothetical protein